jgi:hypothetical protein
MALLKALVPQRHVYFRIQGLQKGGRPGGVQPPGAPRTAVNTRVDSPPPLPGEGRRLRPRP